MFDNVGDHSVRPSFQCVQILILQHREKDYMIATRRQKMRNEEVEKLRVREPQSAKRIMKLVWKIHEIAEGKGPLS